MQPDNTAELGDVETKILVALSGFNNVRIYTRKVAELVGISEQRALYHLTELETLGFVGSNGKARNDAAWELVHKGRGNLVKRGLLA
jgi:predicted ArsR family transcriptional regulator